jgi:hypothetical protein
MGLKATCLLLQLRGWIPAITTTFNPNSVYDAADESTVSLRIQISKSGLMQSSLDRMSILWTTFVFM